MQATNFELNKPTKRWSLYVDASSTSNSSGVGVVLISPKGFMVKMAIKISFKATNNKAEYEAILAGIKGLYNSDN